MRVGCGSAPEVPRIVQLADAALIVVPSPLVGEGIEGISNAF
jgi:hypothetical protein